MIIDRDFFRFTERNEWEGETWHFYIPMIVNEEAYKKLWNYCESIESDPYKISKELIPENEVDILVKHSESGYLHFHNKLDIRLDVSKVEKAILFDTPEEADLYKGGIRGLADDN